jgi:phage gp36-like protein
MGLITQEELEDYVTTAGLQRASDKSNQAINVPLVENAIEMASSTVLKFAQGTPGYPWATTPAEAKTICCQLAIYFVYQGVWGFVPIDRKEGFKEAMDELKELRDGGTSWVEGQTPAKQNTGEVFYTNSVDRPREGAPVRARRYFTDKL